MTTMFPIPSNRVVQVKNPYAPTEVLKKFDKDTTGFVTVVGQKYAIDCHTSTLKNGMVIQLMDMKRQAIYMLHQCKVEQ